MPSDLTEPNDLTLDLKVPLAAEDHVRVNNSPTLSPKTGDKGRAHEPGVTLLEYGDYECPHCGAAAPVVKELQRHFGEQLRYAWRHFPLTEIHKMAEPAAETAEWAGVHEHFWEMHDLLLANQEELSDEMLLELADDLALDHDELAEALDQDAFEESVAEDARGGEESGVHSTPTFFINGVRYESAVTYADLAEAIERELRGGLRKAG